MSTSKSASYTFAIRTACKSGIAFHVHVPSFTPSPRPRMFPSKLFIIQDSFQGSPGSFLTSMRLPHLPYSVSSISLFITLVTLLYNLVISPSFSLHYEQSGVRNLTFCFHFTRIHNKCLRCYKCPPP